MDIDKEFPHKYVRASDLVGAGTQRVWIESCRREEMHNPGTNRTLHKPVLRFIDKQMGLVLNVTNAMTIRDCYGPETDDWIMKPLDLHVERMRNGEQGVVVTVPLPPSPEDRRESEGTEGVDRGSEESTGEPHHLAGDEFDGSPDESGEGAGDRDGPGECARRD